MKIGKIEQLNTSPAATTATGLGPTNTWRTPHALLARIVALEKRLTDLALRVYALENRKPKGAR